MSNQNDILDVKQLSEESGGLEAALRPGSLDEFVGQDKLKKKGTTAFFMRRPAWAKPRWPTF